MSIEISGENLTKDLTRTSFVPEDEGEFSLRPQTLKEYIGQKKAKENLHV